MGKIAVGFKVRKTTLARQGAVADEILKCRLHQQVPLSTHPQALDSKIAFEHRKLLYHNRIYIGVIFIRIMEKKMETTIVCWGLLP